MPEKGSPNPTRPELLPVANGQYDTIIGMKINADLTKILAKKHEEKWVALSKDRTKVLDYDISLVKLSDRVEKKNRDFVYMKVLRSDTEYCFSFSWQSD
ncbi:MAG TPA: hypothetical protein VI483_03230 [Candidatus Paceibacterota bacterium]